MADVSAFCSEHGGDHPIHRVLIASNGCGATKCIRSARRWCYETFGDERAVTFISMATPDDVNANAEFVRLADEIVEVPGGANYNNYANVKLIVDIADRLKVDAVWAGWGHASENPALPTALAKKVPPVAFIGPPANAMYLLGDKIASTIIAQSSGVCCLGWSGSHIRLESVRSSRCTTSVAELCLRFAAAGAGSRSCRARSSERIV